MSALLAIARRELVDRRAVIGAAAVASLLPLLAPYIPGAVYGSAAETRGITAWVMALGLTWMLSLFLGAGIIGADLAQGRMGFYFSRPVGSFSIWGGKVLGALILVVAAELLVMLPTAVLPGSEEFFDVLTQNPVWLAPLLLLGVPLMGILLAHTAGIIFRARSAWLILDAAAFVTIAMVCWFTLSPLLHTAPLAVFACVAFLVAASLIALAVAGAVQVAVGRTDLRRSHAVLSTTLWTLMAAATVIVAVFTSWLVSAEPGDIAVVDEVYSAPAGDWIVVSGKSSGRFDLWPRFLLDLGSGAYFQIQPATEWMVMPVAFSGDGGRAAWLDRSGAASWRMVFADLDVAPLRKIGTQMEFTARPHMWLSPRGDRVAVIESRTLSVAELESGRLLSAVKLPEGIGRLDGVFVSEDVFTLRAWGKRDHWRIADSIRLFELEVDGGRLVKTGSIGGIEGWAMITSNEARHRLLLSYHSRHQVRWTLHDARSGVVVADLGSTTSREAAVILGDGRIVRGVAESGEVGIETFSPDGELIARFGLGQGNQVAFSGEINPGNLVVGVNHSNKLGYRKGDFRASVVNVDTGAAEEIPGSRLPALAFFAMFTGERVSSTASRLFESDTESLVLWDPSSDAMTTIVGRQAGNK